ncbi:MAG: CDP-diacylglycerol--serine O-phosphatidyltransferase [Hyphomicrobiaceae bacterium]|nr:CDP-diacylglycerol--serine O-phosphatidyltransferase [Hyphomicrobiaceae bacterium]
MDPTPATPDPGRRRFAQLRRIPIRLVAPNVVTLIALCCGLTSIRMAFDSRWDWAVAGIVFAAILDGVDGRLARALKGTSKFGAELDSLADFVNFGVAPALLLYSWVLVNIKSLGWIAALLFAIAAALRLARFNSMLDKPKPDWQSDFFTGIPAPAGALTVLLPVYLSEIVGHAPPSEVAWLVLVYVLFVGFMMVSTVPTWSGKKMSAKVPREHVLPLLAGIVAFVALLVSYPFHTLAVITLAYLAGLPFGWRQWHSLAAEHGTEVEPEPIAAEVLVGDEAIDEDPPEDASMPPPASEPR